MTPQDTEQILRQKLRDFDNFSSALIGMTIPEFAPPFNSYETHKGDIISYLYTFFESYLKRVKGISCLDDVNACIKILMEEFSRKNGCQDPIPDFDLYHETKSVCKMILECLMKYFKGFPADAFAQMEEVMTAKKCHLLNLLPQIHVEKGTQRIYRVRKGSYKDAKDLFHVPFDQRNKCGSYRFSIAGVPALYGGTTFKTAMLETEIKTDDEISVAILEYNSIQLPAFVDLTIPRRQDYTLWERYSMILFYPLIVACGLKVKTPDAPFKPEYIIPQLFYQLVREYGSDFDGIIFNSTKYKARDFSDYRQSNFVIFTQDCDKESGYCDSLARRLHVFGPLTFTYHDDADITDADFFLRRLSAQKLTV